MTANLPYKKILTPTVAILLVLSLFTISANAQEAGQTTSGSLGIQVSAPVYNFTIDPGSSAQEVIKIRNVSNSTQTFFPEVFDFKPLDETGASQFILQKDSENYTYSLASWIVINPQLKKEGITLKPNESSAMQFFINVPKNAEPGGRYAGILIGTTPPKTTGTQVAISNKVGSLILVRVSGDAKESAVIKEFSTPKNFYEYPPTEFTARIENTGNVHVAPKGVIEIKNVFGKTVASLNVNQKNGNVLPESVRKFDKDTDNLVWNPSSLTIGRYTATLALTYGDPAKNLSQEITFWIVPWKMLVAVLLALIVLLLLFVWIMKRYNKWVVERALKAQGKSPSNQGPSNPPPTNP